MRTLARWVAILAGVAASAVRAASGQVGDLAWPEIGRECRPWAYNWWMGSAVDRESLAKELRRYRDAGLGGIHVIPIYGVKDGQARNVEYLSPRWLELFTFTVREADRLGLGVDLTTGTGWCFGGPRVPAEEGGLAVKTLVLEPPLDGDLTARLRGLRVLTLVARGPSAERMVLTGKLSGGQLDWRPPGAGWRLFLLAASPTGMKVKRASPGEAGLMINPFSGEAMRHYLERFARAFDEPGVARPRAMYHDSFEYYGCQWSADLLSEFARRRGYRLEERLEAFAGEGNPDEVGRVKADYRATVSEMMVENAFSHWAAWCRDRGMLTRNQAHGSPGNLLDLYALAEIPETEMFGRGGRNPLASGFDGRFGEGDREPLISKFASSAAHVAGRRLVSSESCTWMAEHFCETLEEAKCFVDRLFVSGVNHVFFHGCCYSPDDAPWPGWVFYASTEMNPRNAIWRDAPTLNAYIARCQSILQSGTPDNDLLLYWPIQDRWHRADGVLEQFTVHNRDWLLREPIGVTASNLWTHGYSFDYVSDRLLSPARASGGRIQLFDAEYRAVLAPPVRRLPLATLRALLKLARDGATILFEDRLPEDVPGWGELERRRAEFHRALDGLAFAPNDSGARGARVGQGKVWVGPWSALMKAAGIPHEPLAGGAGAFVIRRRHDYGRDYFVANQSTNVLEGWFGLATPGRSVGVMDPLTGRVGKAAVRSSRDGSDRVEARLRLEPGQSLVLRSFREANLSQANWSWGVPGESVQEVLGPWEVSFLDGGPGLPRGYTNAVLGSWTLSSDPEAERFAGTALYRATFDAPRADGERILDLGRVCHSARVTLNGRNLGAVIMHPYRMAIPAGLLREQGNELRVEVTNLSANRLRDLDRRGVEWRRFQDINVVNIGYKPLNASSWPVLDSGLLGPVRLCRGAGF